MRCPHAALGALSQTTAGDGLLHDVSRQPALAGQIAPGWRAGARLEAVPPPLCNGRKGGLWPRRAPPRWRTGNEADHFRNTAARVGETVSTEVFGERKNVPFRGRQGIEPTAAFVDDDDDIAVTAILDCASDAFPESTFQPSFSSRAAQPIFWRNSSISLCHLFAPDSRRRVRLLALVSLAPSVAERPRPAAKPAECKGR